MHYQTLLGECADRILTVTLNRPAKLNAMSATMLAELRAVFSAAATDPAVSVVVLRASGRAFTVGRSEERTSELQSLMRNSYAVFCLKKKKNKKNNINITQ